MIYESTVYNGCTEEICAPLIEKASRRYDAVAVAVAHEALRTLGAEGGRAPCADVAVIYDVNVVYPRAITDGRSNAISLISFILGISAGSPSPRPSDARLM